jgi:hypothetical protein
MDEIDGTIEPYDMTWIFFKMYIFMKFITSMKTTNLT